MDMTILFLFVLQLTSIIYQSMACWVESERSRTVCTSFIEATAEGNEDWFSLVVHSPERPLSLKANAFLRMPNLHTLSVFDLKSIEIGALNGLQKLDTFSITSSQLEKIPAEIFDDHPIRYIQFMNNRKFNSLTPKYFDKLPNILQVDIRRSNLGIIKADVFNGTDIYNIYLDRNHIHTIEDNAFADMEGLKSLSLTDNELKNFQSKRIVGKSYSIKQLWLSQNQLTTINTELLEGLPVIEKLHLEVNLINYIEPGVFSLTPTLDFLDISNNKLVEISPKIFPTTGMPVLYHFFVHNNKLTFLDIALFYRVPQMSYITYGGNPLQCACKDEIKKIADKKNITRLCEDIYSQGERPTCIATDYDSKDCVYDVELTANLYDDFRSALEEYPALRQQCDTTHGIENAKLTNVL